MAALSKHRLCAGIVFVLLCAAHAHAARADSSTPLQFAALSLAQAQSAAIDFSPDVAVARANVDGAAAAVREARGTNGLSAFIGYTELPQGSGLPTGTWSQRLGFYELQAQLGNTIELTPLVTQANAAYRQSLTDELVAERAERLKVITLYFAAISARAEFSAKQDTVAGADDFETDVRTRYAAGKLPYLDLLRAEVALSKARADAAVSQGADANATDALARETGLTETELRETAPVSAAAPVVVDPDHALARAFAQRPELSSADQNVRAAQAGFAAAKRAFIPPITVAGGYVRGVDAGTSVGGPALNASVTIPLVGTAGAQLAASAAAVRSAMAKREGVRRTLALEVAAAAHTANSAIIARSETDATLDAARSALQFAMSEYKLARTSGLSVSSAREIYDQAVSDDIAAQYALMQAQATLDVELAP